jgi:HAD superfamily hydrolase (TIGR01509 family)
MGGMTALLLDLDGTLIDSEPWYKQVELETLRSFGAPVSPEELEGYTGRVLGSWLAAVNERHGTAIDQERFLWSFRPQMERHLDHDIDMFPDAERLLWRTDVPVAIVTSSLAWYVESALRRFPVLRHKPKAVVSAADVCRGKPDPEPYLMAARLLGIEPSSCTALEDSQNGVDSALAAGCRVVAVARNGKPPVGAHEVLNSLDEFRFSVQA